MRGEQAPEDLVTRSFTEFYRQAHAPMVRLAFLLTGGSPAAEEVVSKLGPAIDGAEEAAIAGESTDPADVGVREADTAHIHVGS